MPKATTLQEAALAVVGHNKALAESLRRDRDWLWLVGDFKDDEDARAVMKEAGYRFSRKGHEIEETGEIAHWYFGLSAGTGRRTQRVRAKAKKSAVKATDETVNALTKPAKVSPELTASADEFEGMFG